MILETDRAQVFILHTQIHPTVFRANGIASPRNIILSQGLEKLGGCCASVFLRQKQLLVKGTRR